MKTRYYFSHTSDDGKTMYWYSVLPIAPNESRHEQIACPTDWFWRFQ